MKLKLIFTLLLLNFTFSVYGGLSINKVEEVFLEIPLTDFLPKQSECTFKSLAGFSINNYYKHSIQCRYRRQVKADGINKVVSNMGYDPSSAEMYVYQDRIEYGSNALSQIAKLAPIVFPVSKALPSAPNLQNYYLSNASLYIKEGTGLGGFYVDYFFGWEFVEKATISLEQKFAELLTLNQNLKEVGKVPFSIKLARKKTE